MRDLLHWPEAEVEYDNLFRAVRDAEEQYPGHRLGVGTGWASPKVLQEREEYAALIEWCVDVLDTPHASLHLWGNVLGRLQSIGVHDHHKAVACGVYYLEVGDGSGVIEFEDHAVRPRNGDLIVFGPLEKHWVLPNKGGQPRVSLSINLYA